MDLGAHRMLAGLGLVPTAGRRMKEAIQTWVEWILALFPRGIGPRGNLFSFALILRGLYLSIPITGLFHRRDRLFRKIISSTQSVEFVTKYLGTGMNRVLLQEKAHLVEAS